LFRQFLDDTGESISKGWNKFVDWSKQKGVEVADWTVDQAGDVADFSSGFYSGVTTEPPQPARHPAERSK
jgi:hypothetical protein